MKGREEPCADRYKEIKNAWNYDAISILTSLAVSHLEDFKRVNIVSWSVVLAVSRAVN
jgi:hypothetical protein